MLVSNYKSIDCLEILLRVFENQLVILVHNLLGFALIKI